MKKILLPILLLAANVCIAQVDLNLGLRAYYPFSGNANDVSGNNNNPVFNNAALTADRFGNPNSAYHFNGTNNYMRIPNSPTLNMGNKLSLSMWVKPTGYYTGQCYNNIMLIKGDADNEAGRYSSRFSDVATGCSATPTTTQEKFFDGFTSIATTPIVQLNQWYSVVITFDGTTSRIYVNCVLRGSTSNPNSFTNAFDLFLGHLNSAQFPYWLDGDLDEVRIYDRALNVDEVNTLGGCITPFSCNNWLYTPSMPSYVNIGDVDVSGDQLTVEANFNRTFPLNNGLYPGHLVSKNSGPTNVNYAIFPNGCAITTSTGYKNIFENCPFGLNKTYHVAMVYNGSTLKFYRNGFLHSQIPCTGNMVTNDFLTTLAQYAGGSTINEQFLGYINEVRIWNVARTQAQIQTYMNNSIPNPTTQPGLLAYYTFDNLLNKQGNAAYNGTLTGAATINNNNPNCTFIADSCAVTTPGISNIINTYTPVTGFNICDNKFTVEDASTFNAGDTVLLIQMKGAVIDSTNTAAFGTITDYKNSGNYEFNYVKSKSGNIIELKNKVIRQYDIPAGKVQLVRVPYYTDVAVSNTLTCLPWDGNKGGILAFNVLNTLTLNADMDVTAKGFTGGIDPVSSPPVFNCSEDQYYYPQNPDLASGKGEGITIISAARSFGKGALANGGGGGNSHNSGGAGGGNISAGGLGGYQLEGSPCNGTVVDNRGVSGKSLTYSNAANKIFLGGGGGAGHSNNFEAFQAVGGNGGGIIIFSAGNLISNTKKIISNGNAAPTCGLTTSGCHEGMGGGGAAGTVLIKVNSYSDNANIETKGGKGANMTAAGFTRVGTGGGGSGGAVWLSNTSLPANVSVTSAGGASGVCTGYANDPWGATAGTAGQNLFNLILPVSAVAFQKNIDSVRIKDTLLTCNSFRFISSTYTNTYPIATWQWFFGDGGTASTVSATHTYINPGPYIVKLVVTDINGCKDSIIKNVTASIFIANAGNDTSVCTGPAVTVTLHASAGTSYAWTPAAVLNNPFVQNPVATISATTMFYVTITNAAGCSATDSVLITLTNALTPAVTISTPSSSICTGTAATFTATAINGGSSPVFQWQKNGNPVGTNSNTYTDPNLNNGDIIKCTLTSNISCAVTPTAVSNTITMTVSVAPANIRYATVTTLFNQPLQLQARNLGGNSYTWTPASFLNNNLIINPVFTSGQDQEYKIVIKTATGCQVTDTLLVKISGKKGIYVPKAFSPNGDGTNDRLYPILVGIRVLNYFRVYNRWGNLVFETNSGNPAAGWNGKINGNEQPPETYTWTVEGIDIDGIVIKKSGNTFLVR